MCVFVVCGIIMCVCNNNVCVSVCVRVHIILNPIDSHVSLCLSKFVLTFDLVIYNFKKKC